MWALKLVKENKTYNRSAGYQMWKDSEDTLKS